jgi:hypothetical protein
MFRTALVVAVVMGLGPCSSSSSGQGTAPASSGAPDATASVTDAGSLEAGVVEAGGVDAGPVAPLGWGTRPEDGSDFFVAMDGDCLFMVLHPVHGATFAQLRSWHGVARLTPDGLDLSYLDGVLAAEDKQGYGAGSWEFMTGTPEDLWVRTMPPGSVFRPSGLLHRSGGVWSAVAPLGTEKMAYTAVAPFQGGAIGAASVAEHGEAGPHRLFGVGGVNVNVLFPADATISDLRTLENGLVAAVDDGSIFHDTGAGFVTEYNARAPRVFLLGPKDTRAHAARVPAKKGEHVQLHGYTTTTLRAVVGKSSFVFDGEDFIAEPAGTAGGPSARSGDIDASHANGSTDARVEQGALLLRQGTTYRPARLPVLPMSPPGRLKVAHVTVASDGEIFVVMNRVTRSRHGFDQTWTALLRQKRPRETLRCSEQSLDGTLATAAGVESWPPRLTDACTTPFVIAATYPVGQAPAKGQPESVKVLSRHKELLPVTLVRVETAGRSVVGAAARSAEHARALADVLQKERGLSPEVVCAAPSDAEKLVTVE